MSFDNYSTNAAAKFLIWMRQTGSGVAAIASPTTVTLAKPNGAFVVPGYAWTAATSGAFGSIPGYYWVEVSSSHVDIVGQYGLAVVNSSPAASGVAAITVDAATLASIQGYVTSSRDSLSSSISLIPTGTLLSSTFASVYATPDNAGIAYVSGAIPSLATSASISSISSSIADLSVQTSGTYTLLRKDYALHGANRFVDEEVLDVNKRLTSARIRTYDTLANATSASIVGSPGTSGLLGTYYVSASYTVSGLCRMLVTESGSV